MKLEKREITLNEQDTLQDICRVEESLLHDYVTLLTHIQRKQTRELLLMHIREVAEDLYTVTDFKKTAQMQVGMKE